MSDTIQTALALANRQVDQVIREVNMLTRDVRDARSVSKVILIAKLELVEQRARDLEHTLERLTRDTRQPESEN